MEFDNNGNYVSLKDRPTQNNTSNELKDYFDSFILPDILSCVQVSNENSQPTARFTGGLPGAGKSGIISKIEKHSQSKSIVIDADSLRELLPEDGEINKHFKEDSSKISHTDASWTTMYLRNWCLENSQNYFMDSSLRNPNSAKVEISKAQKMGFKTEVHILAVSQHEALQGVFQRYAIQKEMGKNPRFVDPQIVIDGYESIQESAKAIKELNPDSFKIYNREGKTLYCNKTHDIFDPSKVMALQNHTVETRWDKAQQDKFLDQWDEIIKKLEELKTDPKIITSAHKCKADLVEKINKKHTHK